VNRGNIVLPPDPRMMREDEKPGRLHWISWVIVLLGFVFLIFFVVVPGMRLKLYDAHFREVRKGDDAQRIVELMGRADRSAGPLPELERYWDEEVNPAVRRDQVKSVMTYRVRFLTGGVTWQVGLNADGRAISKHRYGD